MVLDQQIPLEWAFKGPYELAQRLGGRLDAADIAGLDPDRLAELFAQRPALHRYPASMAARVQELCRVVAEECDGDPTRLWAGARSGQELLKTIKALPGFGEQKARIFVALLGKQLGVRPAGWEEAAGTYGEKGSFRSVADIVGPDSLVKVRSYKQEMKAAAKAGKAGTAAPGADGRAASKAGRGGRPAARAKNS